MKRISASLAAVALLAAVLTGCSGIGDKSASLTAVYGVTALLSLVLLIVCCGVVGKKNPWYLLLFGSVLVVNVGYYALAGSTDLQQALMANRLAYLGSVFLPLAMWMIILQVSNIPIRKWVIWMLVGVSLLVFLVAASPGILDIYYKEVTFEKINGVAVLNKVYGPLHGLYLVYLLGYFAAMVSSIVYATLKDKIESTVRAVILAAAVFVNIGVWLIEQLVQIDFEVLSVSYIISELFLLGLKLLVAETEKQKQQLRLAMERQDSPEPVKNRETATDEQLAVFRAGVDMLTPKEREIYSCYLAGLTTAQIMEQLNIKENTLKFHNKNLYSKLGVSSRKQLLEMSRQI